jgi:hypothetical protein
MFEPDILMVVALAVSTLGVALATVEQQALAWLNQNQIKAIIVVGYPTVLPLRHYIIAAAKSPLRIISSLNSNYQVMFRLLMVEELLWLSYFHLLSSDLFF